MRIGIDLGGTNLKAARVTGAGVVRARHRGATRAVDGPDRVLERLTEACEALRDPAVSAIGLAFAGPVDPAAGVVRHAPHLPGWEGVPLRDLLADRTGLPVTLTNDATAYAYGEARVGAGREVSSMVCLTLGTGVGGGIVIDGRPWQGAGGAAGEFGHVCVDPDGQPCPCGGRGCLETVCSASAIGQVEARAAAARRGESGATEIFDRAGAALGQVLGLIANTLAPELIVIGGGMAGAWDLLRPAALEAMARHSFAHNRAGLRVVTATLGDDAGPVGAALIAGS